MRASPWPQLNKSQRVVVRKVLRDIGHAPSSPTVLYGDNKAVFALLHNVDMLHSRVEYIDNRHHACKQQVQLGNVAYSFCTSSTNITNGNKSCSSCLNSFPLVTGASVFKIK